jgi:hypothetical protein
MNEKTETWQEDTRRAFDWLARMYARSQVLMDDAKSMFEREGWSTEMGNGMGGVAMTSVLDDWPFVYLKVFAAVPPDVNVNAATGYAGLFGILFYDGKRTGPVCVGARVEWIDQDANCDHWMLYAALGGVGLDAAAFKRSVGPVVVVTPGKKAEEKWPGVSGVSWFEVPLGCITSAEVLDQVVAAARALVQGDPEPAKKVVGALS